MDESKRDRWCVGCLASIGCLMFVVVFFLVVVGMLITAIGGYSESSDASGPVDEAPEYEEVWSLGYGSESDPKVVRIRLEGVIDSAPSRHGFLEGGRSSTDAMAALDRIHSADADPDVCGIMLEIDSPGGDVTMSDVLFDALMRFRGSQTNRFVLAFIDGTAASGGYYVAAAANRIVAQPTAWTGSIGVIVPNYNASELASRVGVVSAPITSGPNKNLLDMLQPTNAQHVAILRRAVDQAYERFLEAVAEGRGLKVEDIRPYADGRVLTAKDALDAKLIDAIGYREDAVSAVCELAGSDEVRIYRYEAGGSLRDMLRSSILFESAEGMADRVKARVDRAVTPRAEYRLR